jgi:hypothetical protein
MYHHTPCAVVGIGCPFSPYPTVAVPGENHKMSGWDQGQVYHSDPINQIERTLGEDTALAQRAFFDFIRNFRDSNAFIYRCVGASTRCCSPLRACIVQRKHQLFFSPLFFFCLFAFLVSLSVMSYRELLFTPIPARCLLYCAPGGRWAAIVLRGVLCILVSSISHPLLPSGIPGSCTFQ